MSRGLFIIVNAHHESWLKNSYSAVNVARFNAIWTQVSSRFKDKSEKLLFEILNEPQPMVLDNLNALNNKILGIIRETNPTRLVVYAGAGYSSKDDLKNVQVPDTSDRFLIANFHCYDPWSWVSSKDASATWGTDSDKKAIKALFDDIANFMTSKNIPLMVNEFGTPTLHEYNSRMTFYQTYYENALTHGMAFFAWDDGGDFRTYDRQLPQDHKTNGQWVSDVHFILGGNIFSTKGLKAICWSQMSGVQREITNDSDGGKDAGYIDTNDWLVYLVDVPKAGSYQVEYRLASPNSNGVIRIEKAGGGLTYGRINVQNTGGWQNWVTISQTITLSAGMQYIGIAAEVGGYNLNWLKMTSLERSFLEI